MELKACIVSTCLTGKRWRIHWYSFKQGHWRQQDWPTIEHAQIFPQFNKKLLSLAIDQLNEVHVQSWFLLWKLWWFVKTSNLWSWVWWQEMIKCDTSSSKEAIFFEQVYSKAGGSVEVCLVQTRKGNLPFISSLEAMQLPGEMYNKMDPDKLFPMRTRINFGGDKDIKYVPKATLFSFKQANSFLKQVT